MISGDYKDQNVSGSHSLVQFSHYKGEALTGVI